MPGPRRTYYGWWMIGGLCLTEPVSWGVLIYAFSVFVVPMRIELGWTPGELNGAYTTGVVISGLAAIPVGWWLQHHGARGLMTAGSVLAVLALLGWSHVHSLPMFYGCFALAGLAMAASLYEPAFAITASWFHRRRAHAVLIVTIAGGLGSTIFIPLTGALVSAQGWRHALLTLAGIVAVVAVPIHAVLLRRWPADLGVHPDGAAQGSTTALASQTGEQHRRILRSGSFRWITLSLVTNEAGKFAVSVTLVVYFVRRGYPLGWATALAGSVGALQVSGRILSIWLRRRISLHRTAIALFTTQGVALPIPLLTSGHGRLATASICVLMLFFGLAFGLGDLLRGTLVADYYGPSAYARINGFLSSVILAARAGGPLLAGLALTLTHATAPVLIGAALLVLTSAYALHRAHDARTREHIPQE